MCPPDPDSPADTPTCTEDQKGPLFVQFSGVDLVEQRDSDATTQEWYQPIHEPGNLFSYPWSFDLLKSSIPDLTPLTDDPPPWRATDTSTSAYSTTWKGQAGQTNTTGHVDAHSYDVSVSITAQAGAKGAWTAGISGEFDYHHSDSVSSLNTTTASLDASTGIQVNKPAFSDAVAETYVYDFAGYVLGRQLPDTVLDAKTVDDAEGKPVDLQSTGPLAVAFLADPLRTGAPWWRQAYHLPDVGLNHPARWSWSKSMQKASFNARDPNTPPQDDPFYHMKRLLITAADGRGPQRSIATEGDIVLLQARVYNFSLADMASATTAHVRFYGQEYENAQLVGDGFLIGDASIDPIPGFNSMSPQVETPNWTLASTTFDTSGHGGKHLAFWVVAWMEDAQGNLVSEIEGHGLTANPRPSAYTQITQVPVAPYSNNVGLYGTYTPFFVAPKHGSAVEARAEPEQLDLVGTTVSAGQQLTLEQRSKVTASVRNTGGTPLATVPVVFYDGDPQQSGKVYDVQRIPHLRANAGYEVRTFFSPTTCGEHTLFVRAGHATAPHDTGAVSVQVTIDPLEYTDDLIGKTTALGLPQTEELRLLHRLQVAERAFAHNFPNAAANRLTAFIGEVEAQRDTTLTEQQADLLIGQAKLILGCV